MQPRRFNRLSVVFIVVLLIEAGIVAGQELHYNVERAVFRCSGMNRGLAFDGRRFWVGEFGGWIRCYDGTGRRLPEHDLGGGTVRYLGHGVAVGDGFIATGARDFVALLPIDGGPMRRITPPVKGAVCAVACTGKTIWCMNYQSPDIYEMDLDGRLLRRFASAQRSSSSSCDIAVDGDGHLYVIASVDEQNPAVLEYAPDGHLIGTHRLAASATSVAIDPKDPKKTLYTASFQGQPIVYAYGLSAEEPKSRELPKLPRSRRYQPDGTDFVITNGERRFNRPLYGSNTAFFVHGGDLPEFLLSLPGKGGTLRLGLATSKAAKWLPEADHVVARYRGGAMRYEIRDALLDNGRIDLDVVPMGEAEGAVLRVRTSDDAPGVDLVWAFGGASGFNQLNLDTCGYCPESVCLLKPEDCTGNRFTLTESGFELLAPCHQSRPVAGTVPPDSALKIADADKLDSPRDLLGSEAGQRPILVGRRTIEPGKPLFVALQWLRPDEEALTPDALPAAFEAAETHRQQAVQRVRVRAPEPLLEAAAAAICSAGDGLWDPPTYSHGGVRWHFPYLGWRGAYIADDFGWHDRARTHFRAFAQVQVKEPATAQPHADPERDLARQAADSVLYSRGYIPVHPTKDDRGPCDMQQVYVDQLMWHFLWTGDLEFAREMWPVIVDHLEWERRSFDPDGDGLYENYANTLISDAHHYSGGACTQASAYNYRAFRMAARLARVIGEEAEPFDHEADKIKAAINRVLWMPQDGWYAEYRDLLGLKRLHPSAELPSIYHPIDSDLPDAFQAWQMLRYVDTQIEHVPIEDDAKTIWTSNWVPWIWSVRDILGSEVAHMALANWQVGRRSKAWQLYRGALLDAMLYSSVPGACQGTSVHSGRNAGVASDFSCSVGMFGRTLVEGLFGITPDALASELLIRPGLPEEWNSASIDTPDVGYTYAYNDGVESFDVRSRFGRPMRLRLQVPARAVGVAEVTAGGQQAEWNCVPRVGEPMIEIVVAKTDGAKVRIRWQGDKPATVHCPAVVGSGETFTVGVSPAQLDEVKDPQGSLKDVVQETASLRATAAGRLGHRTIFARVRQGQLSWWLPVTFEIRPPLEICDATVDWTAGEVGFTLRNHTDQAISGQVQAVCQAARQTLPLQLAARSQASLRLPASNLVPGTNPIVLDLGDGRKVRGAVVDWHPPDEKQHLAFECLDLKPWFNDRVTQIFKNEYRSPRSPYCSLQMPLHGFGDWCYGGRLPAPNIDDSSLREAAGPQGRFTSPPGVPLATPGPGQEPNVMFTSQWDNYPNEATIELAGRASHVWFLVAGSTHSMHSQFDNGEIIVAYDDGGTQRLPLHNPTTWWPIERDYQLEIDGFCVPGPHPPRIDLGAGRATLLDLPLDVDRPMKSLTIRCLANEVVVGLMSVTILRPNGERSTPFKR
ncbi:MAG: DUF4450 domain-containing protein [Planctomycetes bacterium]|nr:DUF4450 domain-containing protein [Planctomycetota bacterium]